MTVRWTGTGLKERKEGGWEKREGGRERSENDERGAGRTEK
jgi:hypothetical protein